MPKDEEAGALDWKARDKETYASAITKKLINLGIEAKEDGAGEYYEDAVLDFLTDIPTAEKHKRLPSHMHDKEIFPGITVKGGDTPMSLLTRILQEYPPRKTGDPVTDAQVNRTRVFAMKQLAIDIYDEMEILRGRHRKSRTSDKDLEQEFGDWAPQ